MKIKTKVSLTCVGSIVVLGVASFVVVTMSLNDSFTKQIARTEAALMAEKKTYIKDLVESARMVAESYYQDSDTPESQDEAVKVISHLRFQDETGYFFAYTNDAHTCTFAFHGVNQELKGQSTSLDKPDVKGYPFRRGLIEAAAAGGGFVEYHYEKPTTKQIVKKLSYAAPFKPWGWSLAGGMYVDDIEESLNQVRSDAAAEKKATLTKLGLAILGFAIASGFVAFFVASKISRPLVKASNMLKDIAQGEGDLTQRLEVNSEDEIGEVAKWFNTFVEKIQMIVKSIAGNASELADASEGLSDTSKQMASDATETSGQTTAASSAVEELSSNMNNMAAASEQMSTNVKVVAAAIEEMTASISEVAKNAEQAAGVASTASELADSSNQKMGDLGQAADAIDKVIEVIQDIAEQTNLLALNATIEAARAGDAGKGFAVVATEVKELAKQTADATEDIRSRIEGIQSATGESVQSIGEIAEVIQKVNEVSRSIASAVEEQSITTREIAQNVAQTSTAAETVSVGVSQSADAGKEISSNISGVDMAAKRSATGANKTDSASQSISRTAADLQQLVGQFKV